jgi:hypothetical protein
MGARRGVAARAALVLLSTAVTLLVLEFGCHRFGAASDNLAFTLAGKRWFALHWKPLNRLGLRDPEIDDAALERTRRLVVLGDSVAAGQGVDDAADRASGVLRARLAPAWSVVTLAKPGWNTAQETQALRDFAWRPDVVVLWWYLNDIEGAAAAHDVRIAPDLRVEPPLLASLVEHSYLANYWYWRLRLRFGQDLLGVFDRFLAASYGDAAIWTDYEAELDALLAAVRERRAHLLVVVSPELSNVAGTARYAERVAIFFHARGVPTIDLAAAYADRDPATLVVSALDVHPNEAVHADVAQRVLAVLQNEGWVPR